MAIDPQACIRNAARFNKASFRAGIEAEVEAACTSDTRPAVGDRQPRPTARFVMRARAEPEPLARRPSERRRNMVRESPTRRGIATAALVVLLAGPTVLAFFAGGFFDVPRAWAGIIAWLLVFVAALVVPHPLPRDRAAQISLIGLALFAGWTLASTAWAPIRGDAYQAGVRVFVYLGVLLAATALLRSQSAQRLVEPALAAGILIVDRLWDLRASASGPAPLPPLGQRRGSARAAAHVLERDGRTCRDRRRAGCAARR